VKNIYNPRIEVLGILLNKYDKRRVLTQDVEEMAGVIAKDLRTKVFRSKIRASVSVAEFPAHEGGSLYDYAPKCNAVIDYLNFVDELIAEKGMELHGEKG
jgi:chromosome partitioning protein